MSALFIAVRSTGLSYSDSSRQRDGDYVRLAFLPFSTLVLESEADCPAELLAEIVADALTVQQRAGEAFEVSQCGQTVRLGTDLPPFAWASKLVKAGKTYERYHAEETRAESWLRANLKLRKRIKVATVLRAETAGASAWKFFLHRIIK